MRRTLPLLLLLALLAGACGQALGSPRTAAVINGEVITVDQVQPLVLAAAGGVDPSTGQPPSEQQAAVQVLSNLALITLIDQQIEARGGQPVTDADVDAALEEVIAGAGGPEAFEQALDAQGADLATVRLDQRFQLAIDRLSTLLADDVEVSDADIEFTYETQYGLPTVSHILVDTEQEAQDARARIEDGEAFADVARDVSTDPGSADRGGELGPLQIGAFVEEFEEAALALEPGEISQPVQTQFGFHLITTEAGEPLTPELRDQIRDQLAGQQVQGELTDVVFDALLEADATVNPRFGRWAPEIGPDGGLQAVIVPTDPLGELQPVEIPDGGDGTDGSPAAPPPATEAPAAAPTEPAG